MDTFPCNPNGSDLNIAGICNQKGNICAMMPHPERGVSWYHVPRFLHDSFAKSRRDCELEMGPWKPFFESFSTYVQELSC